MDLHKLAEALRAIRDLPANENSDCDVMAEALTKAKTVARETLEQWLGE